MKRLGFLLLFLLFGWISISIPKTEVPPNTSDTVVFWVLLANGLTGSVALSSLLAFAIYSDEKDYLRTFWSLTLVIAGIFLTWLCFMFFVATSSGDSLAKGYLIASFVFGSVTAIMWGGIKNYNLD